MAKVIEFYVRDLFPAEVKSVTRDRGGVIEFPKTRQPQLVNCEDSGTR